MSVQSYTPNAYTPQDLQTLQALADHCGGALDRIHGAAMLKRLEKEVLEISHREQTRIGGELHDDLAQTLGGVAFKAKILAEDLRQENLPQASEADTLTRLLNQAMSDTRRLARGLAPVDVELTGLPAALERLCRESEASSNVACHFICTAPAMKLALSAALHLFRIGQESLRNALRHGKPGRIEVSLVVEGRQLCLTVRDDGRGIEPGTRAAGMGLHMMQYRAEAVGGQLSVQSQPGGGTEIRCVVSDISRWQTEAQSGASTPEAST